MKFTSSVCNSVHIQYQVDLIDATNLIFQPVIYICLWFERKKIRREMSSKCDYLLFGLFK